MNREAGILAVTLAVAATTAIAAEVQVSADFPGGNAILERIEGDAVYLHNDNRGQASPWFYWCFEVRGAAGRVLTFRLGTVFPGGQIIGVRGPAYSLDNGVTWRWLYNSPGEASDHFTFAFPKDADRVRFSLGMPYQQSHLEAFLERYHGNPALRIQTLTTTPKGRKAELLRIGSPSPRYRVIYTARHHASEMMASWALEGIMEAAINDAWLRENVELIVVPFVDKDGVEDGDQGKNRSPHDHGTDYGPTAVHPTVRAIMQQAPGWIGDVPTLAFDLHCPGYWRYWHEVIQCMGARSRDGALSEDVQFLRCLEAVQEGPLKLRLAHSIWPHEGFSGPELPAEFTMPVLPPPRRPQAGAATTAPTATDDLMSPTRWLGVLRNVHLSMTLELPYTQLQPSAGDGVHYAVCDQGGYRAWGRDNARALRRYFEQFTAQDPHATTEPSAAGVHSEAILPPTVLDDGTAEPGLSGRSTPHSEVRVLVDNRLGARVLADAAGDWRCHLPGLSAGTHAVVWERGTATAGNARSAPVQVSIVERPPAPSTAELVTDEHGTVVASGSAGPNAVAHVRVDGTEAARAETDAAGRWTVSLGRLAMGSHQVAVVVTNQGGASDPGPTAICQSELSGTNLLVNHGAVLHGVFSDAPQWGEAAGNASDGNPRSVWTSTGLDQTKTSTQTWIAYRWPTSVSISGVALTSADNLLERDPRTLRLQFSDDGKLWRDQGEPWEIIFARRGQRRECIAAGKEAHRYWRLAIDRTAELSGGVMTVAEIEFWGHVTPDESRSPSTQPTDGRR